MDLAKANAVIPTASTLTVRGAEREYLGRKVIPPLDSPERPGRVDNGDSDSFASHATEATRGAIARRHRRVERGGESEELSCPLAAQSVSRMRCSAGSFVYFCTVNGLGVGVFGGLWRTWTVSRDFQGTV